MKIHDIQQLIQAELEQTQQLIQQKLESHVPLAQEIAQHITQSGGKRIRPTLTLLVAKALNYQGIDAIKLAAIVELLHTATLLHDDVIDESQLRRSQPTANARWGNEASVLVGDLLYARAFVLIAELRNHEVTELISHASGQIVEGEVLQLVNCNNLEADEKIYLDIILRKTGQLFAVATQSVALLMSQTEAIRHALYEFGLSLGAAFQMMDDALDYAADSNTIGKNIGDDLAEGKPTLPMLYALRHAKPEQIEILKQAFTHPEAADIAQIQMILNQSGAIEYTKQKAQEYTNTAIQHLAILEDSPAKNALINLAHLAANRQH